MSITFVLNIIYLPLSLYNFSFNNACASLAWRIPENLTVGSCETLQARSSSPLVRAHFCSLNFLFYRNLSDISSHLWILNDNLNFFLPLHCLFCLCVFYVRGFPPMSSNPLRLWISIPTLYSVHSIWIVSRCSYSFLLLGGVYCCCIYSVPAAYDLKVLSYLFFLWILQLPKKLTPDFFGRRFGINVLIFLKNYLHFKHGEIEAQKR